MDDYMYCRKCDYEGDEIICPDCGEDTEWSLRGTNQDPDYAYENWRDINLTKNPDA